MTTPAGTLGPRLTEAGLAALEAAVQGGLRSADLSGLPILGYGEISCVLLWDGLACKRLPLFDRRDRVEAYRHSFESYLGLLGDSGIRTLESRLEVLDLPDGRYSVYCVQPVLPPDRLFPRWLRQASRQQAAAQFACLLDAVEACGGGRLGLDAQVSNWGLSDDGELLYLDLTTPLYRHPDGREALDTELFVAVLPRVSRGLVRRFLLREILEKYYDSRRVVLDILGNLHNDRLAHLIPDWIGLAGGRFGEPFSVDEVRVYHRGDARLWKLVRRLFRLERLWARRVRGQVYPLLLPDRTLQ